MSCDSSPQSMCSTFVRRTQSMSNDWHRLVRWCVNSGTVTVPHTRHMVLLVVRVQFVTRGGEEQHQHAAHSHRYNVRRLARSSTQFQIDQAMHEHARAVIL